MTHLHKSNPKLGMSENGLKGGKKKEVQWLLLGRGKSQYYMFMSIKALG